MDEDIENIMNFAFKTEAVVRWTHNMYTDDMNRVAFGATA